MDQITKALVNKLRNTFGVDSRLVTDGHETEVIRRNPGAPLILTRNQLLVPIRKEGTLLGVAVVKDVAGLGPKEISSIKDTIDEQMSYARVADEQDVDASAPLDNVVWLYAH